jgi:hypothetical protein
VLLVAGQYGHSVWSGPVGCTGRCSGTRGVSLSANHRRFRRLAVPVAVAAVAAAAFTAASSVPAVAGGGSTWTTVSANNVGWTGTEPSIVWFNGKYEVIWVAYNGSGLYSLLARQLALTGKPIGSVITVLKDWAGIEGDPTILRTPSGQLMIAFGGDEGGSDAAFNNGAEHFVTSSDGVTWTSHPTDSLSADEFADRNTGAAVLGGSPIITGIAENDGVRYHVHAGPETNPAPGPDPLTSTTGNFSSDTALGTDIVAHGVWALWYSDSGISGQDGINAQIIYPSLGQRVHAPGSSAPGVNSVGPSQDLSAANRTSGQLYTAYVTPHDNSIDVWRVGAQHPAATFKDAKIPGSVVVCLAPEGRIWLYWRDRNGWHATRSNTAVTRWEPQTAVAVPKNWEPNLYSAAITSGVAASPLVAIATMTSPGNVNEIRAIRILPRLSVSVSPGSVKRGHDFTVTVTDAGDPVKGASVHFAGNTVTTDKKGQVTLTAANSLNLGRHNVKATISGYTAATTEIKVTK